MKVKRKLKSAFVQSFSGMTLSIITVIGLSPLAIAVPATVSLHSPGQSVERQPQKTSAVFRHRAITAIADAATSQCFI